MTTAEAPPPPLHMAAPILALFCSKTFNNVMIRALSGCPESETAPPFTFTLSLSNPNILEFAESYYSKCLIKFEILHIALKQFQLYLAL
jgi:hypothetical protein